MAVEAMVFASDFGNRGIDELQIVNQDACNLLQLGSNLSTEGGKLLLQQQARQIVVNPKMMLSDRQSELTCNESHPVKRARVESVAFTCHNQITATPLFPYIGAPPKGAGVVPELLVQSRLQESGGASTSGRHALTSQPVSSSVHDFVSLLYQHNLEVDALVRLQNERLRCELEEMCNRHYRSFLSLCGQQAAKQLMEKETGLQGALRRNAELEEKMRLLSAENQLWFNMAKNNEAVVSNLRATLEQALNEGVGNRDTNVVSCDLGAEDAQSCCYEAVKTTPAPEVESRRAKACKICCEKDACILLLPCRHLCLCKVCESAAVACPVCGAIKNSHLQVFMC